VIEIDSPKKLETWLRHKPASWAAAIALRIALRMTPAVGDAGRYHDHVEMLQLAAAMFRSAALSWVTINNPTSDKAATAVYSAARAARAAHTAGAGNDAARAAHAIDAAARAVGRTVRATDTSYTAARAADAAASAIGIINEATDVWDAVVHDCNFLNQHLYEQEWARSLLSSPLWPIKQPNWFASQWLIACETLSNSGQGFEIWCRWFQHRIDGCATSFGLRPDADAEFGDRLINATDKWWKREPSLVNAEVQGWLNELMPPSAKPEESDFAQNPLALNFFTDANEQIGLAPDATANRLFHDAEAQDRHAEVLRAAIALQAASQHGQTQATDISQPTKDFIEALGDKISAAKPSWLVARGETLRRMRLQRQNDTSLAPPLSDLQAMAIDSLIGALDIMVGLDPYLLRIRQASYDAGISRGTGDPVAIRLVIDHALEIKVARADAHDALADAVANVPADAAPDDRRRLTLWADFKNFIQATGRFIWKHKGKVTIAGVTSAITLIQLNAEALKGVFVASPTMLEIIRWIEMIKLPG
jgi:hypothetical protein